MAGRLGIIAGGGGLPRRLIESCRAAGRDIFVLAVSGAAEPAAVSDVPHAWCRLGAAATGLALLLYLKRKRIPGLLVVVGGTAAIVAVVLFLVP